jgi:hypothetical protein
MELYHLCSELSDLLKEKSDKHYAELHPKAKKILSEEIFPCVSMGYNEGVFFQVWASLAKASLKAVPKVRGMHSKKLECQRSIEKFLNEKGVKIRYKWLKKGEKRMYKMYILEERDFEKIFGNTFNSLKLGIL